MRIRALIGRRLLAIAWTAGLAVASQAQGIDPAVVGERLQRLSSVVESLEITLSSQQRQIETLNREVQRARDDASRQGTQRPWAEDLRRLADAISEVDRKRIADNENVLKVLGDLRKALSGLAEQTRSSASGSGARGRDDEPRRARGDDGGGRSGGESRVPAGAKKAVEYVMKSGDTVSGVVVKFNTDAKARGFQALTVQQVLDFNEIADARRVQEGTKLQLPLVPQ